MLLDHLFGPPVPKVLSIVRKNGKMKTVSKAVPASDPQGNITKPLFPARKIQNEKP